MPILNEVPGALERPHDCRVEIYVSDDGQESTITIPPQGRRPLVLTIAALLSINLLLVLCVGLLLAFAPSSNRLVNEIAPGGISPPLRRYEGWIFPVWLLILGLGVLLLLAILRPIFQCEEMRIRPDGVTHERRVFGRTDRAALTRSEVRGFHLARAPEGLGRSTLTLQGQGVEREIAENTSEADREWLVSVGNALLRRW
ncbi:MAG: hypothetical protein M3Y28_02730 [Armatimonadota bacterium]|nr:hypothetical protein [Armatimonadota bacterium]